MYTEKKYPDNHILAGSRGLLYNIHLNRFFELDGNIKPEFSEKITDIGFEWKNASSETWTSVSIKETANTYISVLSDIKDNSIMGNEYMCKRYASTQKSGIYPSRILIRNLTSGNTYNVRSYYIISNNKTYYNQQTTTLISTTNTISFGQPTYTSAATSNVSESALQTLSNKLVQAAASVADIYNMFTTFSKQYKIVIGYSSTGGWVAQANKNTNTLTYNAYYRTVETTTQMRSTIIHELAHINMKLDKNSPSETYRDKIIKFMEFATNMPHAMWIWQSEHNYPVISSATYGYTDDCLVVAACELSKQINS